MLRKHAQNLFAHIMTSMTFMKKESAITTQRVPNLAMCSREMILEGFFGWSNK